MIKLLNKFREDCAALDYATKKLFGRKPFYKAFGSRAVKENVCFYAITSELNDVLTIEVAVNNRSEN
jgi:hypothetical protein